VNEKTTTGSEPRRSVGLWLIGAHGSVATCVAYGLSGLRQGLLAPTGLVTEIAPVSSLPLAGFDEFVLGGHEVLRGDLSRSVTDLSRHGILHPDLVAAAHEDAAAYEAEVRPGLLDSTEVGGGGLDPASARLGAASPQEQIERLAGDLIAFRKAHDLERVVVVNLASVEVAWSIQPGWNTLEGIDQAIEGGAALPASTIYAIAAIRSGCPYVNFTPSLGASPGGVRELALEHGVPHCGSDGKTGETLVKTVLAPMFAARGLKVLAWQGYNMLGNKDGESLSDPARRASKISNKDEALREILNDPSVHTGVGIDYVPSLHDWKTAMDYVHFEGFLGARMSMQFTWSGSDSALASPLVIDLARLADLAASRGERGEMVQAACFFKSPLVPAGNAGSPRQSHDFAVQHRAFLDYVNGVLTGS